MKQTTQYFITLILLILVGSACFYGGMKYQQQKQPSMADFSAMRENRQRSFNQQPSGSMVRGEVIKQDQDSLIIKLADQSSKIILLSETTKVNKAEETTIDEIKTGEQVMVIGQTNSDGSILALQIQLNPGFGFNEPGKAEQ